MRDELDDLIRERAPWLFHPAAWMRPLRALLFRLLSYDRTVAIAEALAPLPPEQIMDRMAGLIAHRVDLEGLDRLPKDGPVMILANHPTGIADGIILWAILRQKRPDLFFFANRDVLRLLPQMDRIIAPVEWRADRRSHASNRETLLYAKRAFGAGRAGVIFPSGRLAKRRGLRLHERDWMTSAAMMARKMDVPVVPLRITARNSVLFYLFDWLHPSLRDITLFHEVLNKGRQPFRLRAGSAIDGRHLPADARDATARLFQQVERLGGERAGSAGQSPLKTFAPARS
ncbi:putative hemolysin [Rubricella aquisinus]|uniref:Putative hemolysin n=1 Tax=Rubricella aquisinus TaxID=2028108 RepID=A0A840X0U9_9RHOB|nr:1-acyl-sn-glycerol-3-phosphate acyltransferase [Rubricella aquisinus]MBB5515506.1 putative hemolysin [Rubricella aquisinus]